MWKIVSSPHHTHRPQDNDRGHPNEDNHKDEGVAPVVMDEVVRGGTSPRRDDGVEQDGGNEDMRTSFDALWNSLE